MKRLVSLFLSLLMLLCCVVPASASGLDSSTDGFGIDAYPYIQNTYISTSGKPAGTSFPVTIDFDQSTQYSYISFVVTTNDTSAQFYSGSTQLTKIHIAGSMYRFYGITGSSTAESFSLSYVKGNASSSYVRFISFRVHPRDYYYPNQSINISVTGSYYYTVSNPWVEEGVPASYDVYVDIDEDYTLTSGAVSIPAIHANYREDTGVYSKNEKDVTVNTFISIPWKKFDYFELSFFSNYGSIHDFYANCDGIDVLSNIQGYELPNFDDGTNYYHLTLDFTSLDPNINSDYVHIRIRGNKKLTSSSASTIINVWDCVGFINTVSTNFWPSWLNKIIDKLDNIFTGRDKDQTAADSFVDSVTDQSNELEDLTADLNSVTRPPLSDVNLSTGSMVDSGTIVLATSGLGSIMSNTIILRVLLMALTFALAGFILFGKR